MEERLDKIFTNINDWLKFAELKNAMLIGLIGVFTFGVIKVNMMHANIFSKRSLLIIMLLCVTSILTSLASFFPKTHIDWAWLDRTNKASDSDNLLFFSDICKYSEKSYLRALLDADGNGERDFTKFEIFYSQQIIINSKIALWKFSLFKLALTTIVLGIIFTALSTLSFYIYT